MTDRYLTYLNFYETLATLLCILVTNLFTLNLIRCHYRGKTKFCSIKFRLCKSLLTYLYSHFILSLISIPYHIYFILHWDPDGTEVENLTLFYVLGIWPNVYLAMTPMFVSLLAVDRCLAIWLAANYTGPFRAIVVGVGRTVILLAVVLNTVIFLLELPLDRSTVATCETFPCMVLKFRFYPQNLTKIVCFVINFGCSFSFFALLRRRTAITGLSKRISDRIVKYTLVLDFLFETLPTIVSSVFIHIVGVPPNNFIGPYAALLGMMNAGICSVLYSRTLLQRRHGHTAFRRISIKSNTSLPLRSLFSSSE
ncbi:hypothetical protein Ddc_16430 [Ditylenchus destructor]|nr:hypothetical protein Ddc_16430 [Ditylenchus destructor]